MNKRNTKRGFTITELVIVIVVIAILAAVLIPTFASLIKKANLSSDEQAAREMNTVLKSASTTAKPAGLKEVVDILEEAGFDALALKPHTKGYQFFWCSEHNVILLVEEENNTVKFPADKKTAETFAAHVTNGTLDATKLFNLKEGTKYINVEVDSSNIVDALQAGSDITLKEDVVLAQTMDVKGDMTINLNGHKLDSGDNASRPLNMTNGANLIVQAGEKDVDCGAYGLVNVPATAKDCSITLEGGKYTATTDEGAFIKVRPGAETVNLTLKNVNYVDTFTGNRGGFIMNAEDFEGEMNLVVEGGTFTANAGFDVHGNAKFVGVNVITNAVAFEVHGNAEIIDCKITVKDKTVGTAPAAAVAVSAGGVAKVSGCTINSDLHAYAVYSTGGTIVATNNKVLHSVEQYKIYAPFGSNVAAGTVGRITIDGKVVAEYTK